MTPSTPGRASRLRLPTLFRGLDGLTRAHLPTEILAGVTLAALMIPLNIGYAQVAGLPPINGLYAAIVPSIVFALVAHTRHLVASPDAAIAAMIAGMVGAMAPPGSERYLDLVLATALLCGAIFVAFWLFRLGFLANFLSHAVLVGFIAGLGIEVLESQVEKILGLSVDADGFFRELWALVLALPEANGWSILVGVGTIVAIVVLGRFAPKLPAALLALLVATVAVSLLGLDERGVSVLGQIDGGLPTLTIPNVTLADLGTLFPIALALCAATLAEAPLIARSYAERYGEPVDADQDLFAMGASNIAAGFTGGIAIGSSASRTAAMDSVGARTQVPSLVAGIVVALVLLFFTEQLAMLPNAALAGIVAYAVVGLIDVTELLRLWRVRRSEAWIALAAAVAVLVVGVLQGVLLAFLLSLFDLLWRAASPHTAVLVELPGGGAFAEPEAEPVVLTRPGLVIYRFGAALFFANESRFREEVERLTAPQDPAVRWLVLDASAVNDIDTSGALALEHVLASLAERQVVVAVSRLKPNVRAGLETYGLADRIGADRLFATNRDAVEAFERAGVAGAPDAATSTRLPVCSGGGQGSHTGSSRCRRAPTGRPPAAP